MVMSRYIRESRIIREIFPWLVPDDSAEWSSTQLSVIKFTPVCVSLLKQGRIGVEEARSNPKFRIYSKDPSLIARAVLGAGTGSRVDDLILDDPVDFANAIRNPGYRPLVTKAIMENWMNALTKDGAARWYGTPWAEDDALAQVKKMAMSVESHDPNLADVSLWRYFQKGVTLDDHRRPVSIWPDYFDTKALEAIRNKQGDTAFARAYRLIAVSDTDRMYSEEALGKWESISPKRLTPERVVMRVGGVDLATSTSDKADYRVVATLALLKDGTRVLVDIARGKWGSVETADEIIYGHIKQRWRVVEVENNGAQAAVKEWVQLRCKQLITENKIPVATYVDIHPHTTTALNKWDVARGLPGVAAEMEGSKWAYIVPDDHKATDPLCSCWWCETLGEFRGMRQNGTSVAEHDDIVMAVWFAREAVFRLGGMPAILGENTRVNIVPQQGIRSRLDAFDK